MLSGGRDSVDLCGRQHSCADLLPLCSTGRVSSLLAYVSTFADEETSSLLVCLHLNHTPPQQQMLVCSPVLCYNSCTKEMFITPLRGAGKPGRQTASFLL